MADELDRIEAEAGSFGTDLQVGPFALSVASSFLSVLLSTPMNERLFTIFTGITIVGFALGSYCIIRWKRQSKTLRGTLQRIRDRQIGPVGTAGERISASDLKDLPGERVPRERDQ
jgi:hypothetical protein